MPFWIAYADGTGARNVATEVELSPRPRYIRYPEGSTGSLIETAGTTIKQQLSADPRIRYWVWDKFPGWMVQYQNLWAAIEPLGSTYRKMAGAATPFVYLKEDETKLMRRITVAGTTVTPIYDWFRCRVLDVSRQEIEPRGEVWYSGTKLGFVIQDPAYNDFL